MSKPRIAWYGVSGRDNFYLLCLRRLENVFEVRCFESVEKFDDEPGEDNPVMQIAKFNPHMVIINDTGNGLQLLGKLRERIHFLTVVISLFYEDSTTRAQLRQAGIADWQIINERITADSFAEELKRFKQLHIDKIALD
ncbi:MAG: hypothetical protein WCV50_04185 [Patescibacteria group bacterium]|jgi:hypothetical protein